MPKPVMFLDVDGVLNAFRKSPWAEVTKTRVYPEGYEHGFLIQTSPLLGQRLLELEADIHWLTTWKDEANVHISPLVGFPDDLPVVEWERRFSEGWSITGKGRAVRTWQEENPDHPFIWIDDEHASGVTDHGHYLIVGPEPGTGLTPEEITTIEDWILSRAALRPPSSASDASRSGSTR